MKVLGLNVHCGHLLATLAMTEPPRLGCPCLALHALGFHAQLHEEEEKGEDEGAKHGGEHNGGERGLVDHVQVLRAGRRKRAT